MIKETITRIKLTASEGMTLTDGETFGKEIYLANTEKAENWYEITDDEAMSLQQDSAETSSEQGEK